MLYFPLILTQLDQNNKWISKGTPGHKNKLILIDSRWLVKTNSATSIFIGKLGNTFMPGQFWPCLSFASLSGPSSMALSPDFWSCGPKLRPLHWCDMNLFSDGVTTWGLFNGCSFVICIHRAKCIIICCRFVTCTFFLKRLAMPGSSGNWSECSLVITSPVEMLITYHFSRSDPPRESLGHKWWSYPPFGDNWWCVHAGNFSSYFAFYFELPFGNVA